MRRMALVLAGMLTVLSGVAVRAQDHPVRDDPFANNLSNTLRPVVVGSLGVMTVWGDEQMSEAGRYGFDAAAATTAATQLVKAIARQPRPLDLHATDGFPSGHAATAFTFARSIAHFYPDAAPYAYAWAAGVGWSRVQTRRHSWTQVAAGAALGTWVANESVHRDGGLLWGVFAPEHRSAMSLQEVAAAPFGGEVVLWETSW